MKRSLSLLFLMLMVLSTPLFGQENDSLKTALRKNTIRWNITPMLILGPKSIVLGYERVINNHQTASINIGYLERAPKSSSNRESVNLFDEKMNSGFALAIDYRFYFKKRNINPAPDGLYWGPYTGYYGLGFDGKSNVTDIDGASTVVNLSSNIEFLSLGVQLGYQFLLFNDRFSVDLLLMGPSFTRYFFNMGIDGGVALDQDSEFYEELKEILNFLIPGSGVILEGQQFSQDGKVNFNYFGFRYGVQLGFRF